MATLREGLVGLGPLRGKLSRVEAGGGRKCICGCLDAFGRALLEGALGA